MRTHRDDVDPYQNLDWVVGRDASADPIEARISDVVPSVFLVLRQFVQAESSLCVDVEGETNRPPQRTSAGAQENQPAYLKFSNKPLVTGPVFFAGFPSEQLIRLHPIVKVSKLTFQFLVIQLWRDSITPQNTSLPDRLQHVQYKLSLSFDSFFILDF